MPSNNCLVTNSMTVEYSTGIEGEDAPWSEELWVDELATSPFKFSFWRLWHTEVIDKLHK